MPLNISPLSIIETIGTSGTISVQRLELSAAVERFEQFERLS
jgi:hypothetical protein